MLVQALNSGKIPKTNGTYENLEGLLLSYYLTYQYLKDSDPAKYKRLILNLNAIAKNYRVLPPEESETNYRTFDSKWKPRVFESHTEALDMVTPSFYGTFKIESSSPESEPKVMDLYDLLRKVS